jgi:hypothetical protein
VKLNYRESAQAAIFGRAVWRMSMSPWAYVTAGGPALFLFMATMGKRGAKR